MLGAFFVYICHRIMQQKRIVFTFLFVLLSAITWSTTASVYLHSLNYQDTIPNQLSDSVPNLLLNPLNGVTTVPDSVSGDLPLNFDIHETPDDRSEVKDMISKRSIIELLRSEEDTIRFFSWRFNPIYLSNDTSSIDTLFRFRHLVYPQQKHFETYTYTGNLGGAVQYDHFFTRNDTYGFLFSRYFDLYADNASENTHYNVRSPLTRIFYSSGGPSSKVEQVVHAVQTQNIGKHFNFGVSYDFYGTKGRYERQDTRDNILSLFASYYKGNLSAQVAFINKVYKQEDNGGVVDPSLVRDTIVELLPFRLSSASSVIRNMSASANVGYTLLNVNKRIKKEDGSTKDNYIPLISTRLLLNYNKYSRLFTDTKPSTDYYNHFYISNSITRDSVASQALEAKLMLEISQFAKIPGMPGLRGWIGYDWFDYHLFNPNNYLFLHSTPHESSAHIGLAAFSDSPFLGYRGAIRMFFSGYRADDKVVDGEVWISPWKDKSMPRLKGTLKISEVTPDIFLTSYLSNHIKWDNHLKKEKRFMLKGALEAKRWEAELGYNLVHIKDFIFFDESSMLRQADNVTITSFYAQKNFNLFNGLNIFNRATFQANTNHESLSLPSLILFSSIYYERVLVRKALTAQLGFNVYYRSKFYADAYNPVVAQFHNQREEKLGGYPFADLFLNFKWKRALIYLKVEHVNQGFPDNNYFATYLHPYNPTVFKYGILWTFYD